MTKKTEEKIALTIGKKSVIEISDWFGINRSTFSRSKERYLQELEDFAIFHLEGKKVVIDEVLQEYYEKKNKTYKEIRKLVPKFWNKKGLDTCSNVSQKIYETKMFNLSISSIRKYVLKAKNELYGKIEKGRKFGLGIIGKCEYVFCKKDLYADKYSLFTKEEENKIKEIRNKYFGDANKAQDIVNDMIYNEEIDEKEGITVLNYMTKWTKDKFINYKSQIEVTFNCYYVRATLIENNAFIDLDKFLETGEIITFTLDLSGNA